MPSCFQLIKIGKTEPENLNKVDEDLCQHFGVPVDPKLYYEGWFNTIGLSLAMGRDWDGIREIYHDVPELLEVVDYLEEHYTPNTWWEPK